jgi:hypothetical protein
MERFHEAGSGGNALRPPYWAWTPRSGAIAPCVGRRLGKKLKNKIFSFKLFRKDSKMPLKSDTRICRRRDRYRGAAVIDLLLPLYLFNPSYDANERGRACERNCRQYGEGPIKMARPV